MSTTKDRRLELRLTADQKQTIEAAAAAEGRNVSEFSTQTLMDHAENVLRQDRVVRLNEEAFEQFSAVLDRPAAVLDGLTDLLARPSVFRD
jgi:uncharacterized protein (DUF1778 family)